MDSEKYLPELMAEKDSLDPSFLHALRLVNQEIEKLQKDEEKEDEKFIDVVINKNMKLGQKVLIPVKQFPKFNFVGKLLGPRGNSLKRLQEDTLTKMSILGKGSMRDKEKEEELRKSGEAKYQHLNEDLHVLIEVFAPPAEAYARMGHALDEIKKFLIPDYNDEIRQAQLQELTYLNGGSEESEAPAVRGKPVARSRGTTGLARGRGGVPSPQAGVPRGAPAPRGSLPGRLPATRTRGIPAPRARGVPPPVGFRHPPPPAHETYGEYDYGDGYGAVYDDEGFDSYDNSYGDQVESASDYYDYGHGISEDLYDSYGQEEWTNNRHKAVSARITKGVYREQPYSRY
ncbi:KH domain-containing, RNA-binding, signal transduction-associated protein 3 [Erpetoichthys calabaricus]|uniref:KH domain-containing, RNA-binding, signal transduction-associated protein 3 n=1 Tax=Erpetoichthys calabaricus TaxID=27687 RepID=UPI0022343142|nr:KH domain-containing, RNA-binding, signal transduction-associated protein 3 [Erpetoichthys calabaricus]